MNSVHLIGNLTRDPEMRYTPSGSAIANTGIAINRKWNDNGERKEEVTFVDLTAFGKQAETAGQYLRKGAKVAVVGRLKLDQWNDKQTQEKRSKLCVVVEHFEFLDSREERGQPAPPPRTSTRPPSARPPMPPPADTTPEEDDVPF